MPSACEKALRETAIDFVIRREFDYQIVDFAKGGIYDDAYSATLVTHLLASMSRVYGGFALAALFALPIGLLIGRLPTARMLLDPFLQLMRPIPVTAWLPLSMILFGLGAKSAFARGGNGLTEDHDHSHAAAGSGSGGCSTGPANSQVEDLKAKLAAQPRIEVKAE